MADSRVRWRRYAYTARKYWSMNPLRLWWVLHVWDEITADLRSSKETSRG